MTEDLLVSGVPRLEKQLGKPEIEPREPVKLTIYPLVEKYPVRLIGALPDNSIALNQKRAGVEVKVRHFGGRRDTTRGHAVDLDAHRGLRC